MNNENPQQGSKLNLSVTSQIRAKIWCCNYRTELHVNEADSPRNLKLKTAENTVEVSPMEPVEPIAEEDPQV